MLLDALLRDALRLAPRRFRMPPLPADADAARRSGPEAALAFSIEQARCAASRGAASSDDLGRLFTASLATLIRSALLPGDGDPVFQALVLQARDPDVAEHVRLVAQAMADGRAVRAAVNAVAHPGKLQGLQPGARRDGLSELHGLAATGAWSKLRPAMARGFANGAFDSDALHAALASLQASPGLARLERGAVLLALDGVQRYRALCERSGPLAGTTAAAAQGRASARLGARAESVTVQALGEVAELLNRQEPPGLRCHVAQGLLTPGGLAGVKDRGKDEWDAAFLQEAGGGGAMNVALLVEVKAAPAAAAADLPRLLRGLERLAQADAQADHAFASTGGPVLLRGASLRGLAPQGDALPPHVIYACAAPAEARIPLLSAAARAMLLAEPASVAFAVKLLHGDTPEAGELAGVWSDLVRVPRLRSALHQYDAARRARDAMLHPQDLLAAVATALRRAQPSSLS